MFNSILGKHYRVHILCLLFGLVYWYHGLVGAWVVVVGWWILAFMHLQHSSTATLALPHLPATCPAERSNSVVSLLQSTSFEKSTHSPQPSCSELQPSSTHWLGGSVVGSGAVVLCHVVESPPVVDSQTVVECPLVVKSPLVVESPPVVKSPLVVDSQPVVESPPVVDSQPDEVVKSHSDVKSPVVEDSQAFVESEFPPAVEVCASEFPPAVVVWASGPLEFPPSTAVVVWESEFPPTVVVWASGPLEFPPSTAVVVWESEFPPAVVVWASGPLEFPPSTAVVVWESEFR